MAIDDSQATPTERASLRNTSALIPLPGALPQHSVQRLAAPFRCCSARSVSAPHGWSPWHGSPRRTGWRCYSLRASA